MSPVKRLLASIVVLAALLAGSVLVYNIVSRDRAYRRLIGQGEASLAQGHTFQAIEAFSGALALKPSSMLAHLRRGETYRRRGDLQAALPDLQTANRLDPTATRPWEALGDLNYALERDSAAVEAYEAYVRLDNQSPRVLYKLGLAQYRIGNLEASLTTLRQAVSLDERFAEAYYLMGLCLSDLNRHLEAIQALERTVALQPALAPPREKLAELYAGQGRHQEEVQQLEALAVLDPSRVERHIALGLGYARGDHSDMAVMALGRAAERLPNQPEVYIALGRVWLERARERRDPSALRKALEALGPIAVRPTASGEALALYGRALLLDGQHQRAEQMLRVAVSRLPVDPQTFLDLSDAAQRLDHLDLAREALVQRDALMSDDDRDRGARAIVIGDLSMRLNDIAGAVHWYERALATVADDAELLRKLDQARRRLPS
jgi:tetratricopeptide (TPR) repeat protein